MSFQQFAEDQFIKTFETDEVVRMGSFQTSTSGELAHIRVVCYVRGILTGTEKIRIKIYSDSLFSSLLYTSDWAVLPYSDWIGWIRCDFDNQSINKNITYYITCEVSGYVNDYPNLELGLAHDFPYPIYATSETFFYDTNLAFQIFLRA